MTYINILYYRFNFHDFSVNTIPPIGWTWPGIREQASSRNCYIIQEL